jgi:hypothetical protein
MADPLPEYKAILAEATSALMGLKGHTVDVIDITRPPDLEYAVHLSKVVSKLSPFVANLMEQKSVAYLNSVNKNKKGKWERQDPGFPDVIFRGDVKPMPGVEVKMWFPLATEITARFKDSVSHFAEDQTNVAMLAWVPANLIYGKPLILDCWVDTARSLAEARDKHYHNPPDYLVFEPENTSARTANLQQTNTNGYKFQGTREQLAEAQKIVDGWGKDGATYSHLPEYQAKLRTLYGKYTYRLDTNYAKTDRIEHESLEAFKVRVCAMRLHGYSLSQWCRILGDAEKPANKAIIERLLSGGDAAQLALPAGHNAPGGKSPANKPLG